MASKHSLTVEDAEIIALQVLAFLAEDQARLERFLALTGLSAAELRATAGTPATLQAVLEHLARDESLLLVFAAAASIAPEQIGRALDVIAGLVPSAGHS